MNSNKKSVGNPAGTWRTMTNEQGTRHVFLSPGYAVYGYVGDNKNPGGNDMPFTWEARTYLAARPMMSADAPTGHAPTLDAAKAIVETLLYETGTVPRPARKRKSRVIRDA